MTVSPSLLQRALSGNAVRIGVTLDNHGFEEAIDSCHQYLYPPATGVQFEEIVDVSISSDTPNIGFLDPQEDHEFYCVPLLNNERALNLAYSMRFERLSAEEVYAEVVAEGRASVRVPVDPQAFAEPEEPEKEAE